MKDSHIQGKLQCSRDIRDCRDHSLGSLLIRGVLSLLPTHTDRGRCFTRKNPSFGVLLVESSSDELKPATCQAALITPVLSSVCQKVPKIRCWDRTRCSYRVEVSGTDAFLLQSRSS